MILPNGPCSNLESLDSHEHSRESIVRYQVAVTVGLIQFVIGTYNIEICC